jgi:DNA-binding MarR family transcriptional regulator
MSKSRAVGKSSTTAPRRKGTKVSTSRARQGGADTSLDFSLEESLALRMRDLHRIFTRSLERRIGVYGITATMWYYLRLLWERNGATQRELSEDLGIRGPTTVEAIAGLEVKQLIRRQPDPKDKRKVVIHLTPKGIELKHILLKFALEVQDIATSDVSVEEFEIMRTVLRKMQAALLKDQAGGLP